jgi:hypothetical protein
LHGTILAHNAQKRKGAEELSEKLYFADMEGL